VRLQSIIHNSMVFENQIFVSIFIVQLGFVQNGNKSHKIVSCCILLKDIMVIYYSMDHDSS
jgi:hypothetical protein